MAPIQALWRMTCGWERRRQLKQWLKSKLPDRWLYGPQFYAALDQSVRNSMAVIAADLINSFQPKSAVDVGCGNGWLLAFLKDLGCTDLQGFEYSNSGVQQTRARNIPAQSIDLRTPLTWNRRYDLCACLEVAEHVDPRYADNIVHSLTSLAPLQLFSAAVPGQGGLNHLNEQPHQYWIEKFAARGFLLDRLNTERLRHAWQQHPQVARWYSTNAMIFRQSETP